MTETTAGPDQRAESRDGDIQAVIRCGQVLQILANEESVRATDVATKLGLQRSTAHRYLASMANAGMIERGDDGTFGPGPLVVHLGAVAMRSARVLDVAAPYLSSLAAEAHETVVLSLWGGSGAVVTRVWVDSTRLVNVSVREGSELPLYAAQSQVFLGFLPDRETVKQLIDNQPAHLQRELSESIERVRATGFGEHSMVVQGIHAVSAPVYDSRGIICASIALVGTSDALLGGPESKLWRALGATGQQISGRLGYASN